MNETELELKMLEKLMPFWKRCNSNNLTIANIYVEEQTSYHFYVWFCMPNLTAEEYDDVFDKISDIYREFTDEETKDLIFAWCITDECFTQKRCCPSVEFVM